MDDLLELGDRFYILAEVAPPDVRTLVLKQGELFGVFNSTGDIDAGGQTAQGLYHQGMRALSRLSLRLNGSRLLLLGSRVTSDNTRIIVDLTNPDVLEDGRIVLPRGTLHLMRSRFLWSDAMFEKLSLANFARDPVHLTLSLSYGCDFADIFEVRGTPRTERGELLEPALDDAVATFEYRGLDDVVRTTRIEFDRAPDELAESRASFHLTLPPRKHAAVHLCVRCEPSQAAISVSYDEQAEALQRSTQRDQRDHCLIESSDHQLDAWLKRSYSDIRMLLTPTEQGLYPYAGVPWFSAPFGRDGIITALQTLWVNPDIARGVLSYLAATQADEVDPQRDAEPGKIIHERRTDEMANTGEVPFGRYYGSADATPLFIVLAGEYHRVTGDLETIDPLWPAIEAALNWIDHYGDIDGDGFVEYRANASDSLLNQGWKDSQDAVFHADGSLPSAPIALCEVQGYVYDAKVHAAELARALGLNDRAQQLGHEAQKLREDFQSRFWDDSIGSYALALDGDKKRCAVRTSNAGHCLYSGVADDEHAAGIARLLMGRSMYSGWGVRTVASSEARYNPMSYHNGSVWPHDNAIIAAGLARYGYRDEVLRLFRGWLDASHSFELHRLPELFCGFRRHSGKGPTAYPVACSPQAWAAGAVYMLLTACLGMTVDGVRGHVRIHRPRMPQALTELRLHGLRVGQSVIDLLFHRERHDVGVLVLRKHGPADVVVTK